MAVVELQKKDAVATLTISREKSLNALNQEVLEALQSHVNQLEKDAQVRVVKITGAGEKAFVAGADIGQMQNLSPTEAKAFSDQGHGLMRSLEESKNIYIACVQGFALGGGCELALACDLIYASTQARFGLPEVGLGLIPGFGGTQRLPRQVGLQTARAMIYTGTMLSAEQAKACGLVADVFDSEQLHAGVDVIISQILQKGPDAIVKAKKAMIQGQELALDAACNIEQEWFSQCFEGSQAAEGMTAFLEKRKPTW
jgi:enoyl-CoA hydratase